MIASTELALDSLYGNAPVTPGATVALYDNGVIALLADRAPHLREALHRQIASIELIKQDFLDATDLLRRNEIPFLSIKGLLLGLVLYGDYASRGFEDIDLAIPADRYKAAVEVFASNGYAHRTGDYRDDSVEVLTCPGNRSTLEAHFSISTADRFGRFYDDLWRAPGEVEFEGRCFSIPGREEYLIFLLIHLVRHLDAPRAIWFEDIRRMLDRFGSELDWDALLRAARNHKLANVLSIGTTLCDRVFNRYQVGASFPGDVRAGLDSMRSLHGRTLYRFLLKRIESGEMTPFQRRLHSFGISENWGDRFRMARDFLRIKLG